MRTRPFRANFVMKARIGRHSTRNRKTKKKPYPHTTLATMQKKPYSRHKTEIESKEGKVQEGKYFQVGNPVLHGLSIQGSHDALRSPRANSSATRRIHAWNICHANTTKRQQPNVPTWLTWIFFHLATVFFVPGPLVKIHHIPIPKQSHRSAAISWAWMEHWLWNFTTAAVKLSRFTKNTMNFQLGNPPSKNN